jgi:6-phosphogluconolactonase
MDSFHFVPINTIRGFIMKCFTSAGVCWLAGSFLFATLFFNGETFSEAGGSTGKLWVYVGTYTKGTKSKGIYRLDLDMATGKLSGGEAAGTTVNPSFLAIHPNHQFLYAVGEIDNFKGKKSGGVSAFALDAKTGNLTLLNQQTSSGAGPCHLSVDKTGKNVLVANYDGGSISVLPIVADGKLGEPTAVIQHKGSSGVVKGRQDGPHAHSINLDAANRFAIVADLGLDKVFVYKFDAAKGTLTPNDPPAMATAPGAGPRHFAFQPDGKKAYVINELDSTLTALSYDADKGILTKTQSLSTLPGPVKGSSTAEVVVHPSGKFVYGSNRGDDSIAIFTVDAKTGNLTAAGYLKDPLIKTPRNFAVDPSGKYLVAAGQSSGKVAVFAIDQKSGALTPTGSVVDVPAPVCIRFLAPAK